MSDLVWQDDDAVTRCFLCGNTYNFFNRRHHCRKCGRVVCASCSDQSIQYFPNTLVVNPNGVCSRLKSWERYRTCDECAETTMMIRRALAEEVEPYAAEAASSDDNNSTTKTAGNTFTRMVSSSTNSSRLQLPPANDDDSDHNLCPVCATNLAKEFRRQTGGESGSHDFDLFKERHIDDCLVAFDFNADHQRLSLPRNGSQRHRNKMLVYNMPPIPKPQYETIPSTTLEGTSADTVKAVPGEVFGSVNTILSIEPSEKNELDQECVICLEDLKAGDKVGRLECLCVFHYKCIKDWFNKKGYGECPVHYAPVV
jgi:hypothetical protein